ncbi:hypothetical protein [Photobacterium kasasachensis]|uniref:hypothetical protein n=1 Tax=Photobacterium kasasachensis TaxID=2910240 RepID=UPI003D14AF86
MAKIEIPSELKRFLGPPMVMDTHWVDIKLANGRVYKKLVVRNNRYITGRHDDPGGIGNLPFVSEDIVSLRRQSCFPYWLHSIFND